MYIVIITEGEGQREGILVILWSRGSFSAIMTEYGNLPLGEGKGLEEAKEDGN